MMTWLWKSIWPSCLYTSHVSCESCLLLLFLFLKHVFFRRGDFGQWQPSQCFQTSQTKSTTIKEGRDYYVYSFFLALNHSSKYRSSTNALVKYGSESTIVNVLVRTFLYKCNELLCTLPLPLHWKSQSNLIPTLLKDRLENPYCMIIHLKKL